MEGPSIFPLVDSTEVTRGGWGTGGGGGEEGGFLGWGGG